MSTVLYTPSVIIDTVAEAIGAFLQPFVGTAQIVRARQNRVAMPSDPCVILNDIGIYDLETPTTSNDSANQLGNILGPARIDFQADIYGSAAGDQCKSIKGVFRTPYATSQFPANIQPLYCSDGIQSPLVTGEEQYDSRWIITMSFEYLPVVTVPQQSAIQLAMNITEEIN